MWMERVNEVSGIGLPMGFLSGTMNCPNILCQPAQVFFLCARQRQRRRYNSNDDDDNSSDGALEQ